MDRQNYLGFTYKSPINLLYLFTVTVCIYIFCRNYKFLVKLRLCGILQMFLEPFWTVLLVHSIAFIGQFYFILLFLFFCYLPSLWLISKSLVCGLFGRYLHAHSTKIIGCFHFFFSFFFICSNNNSVDLVQSTGMDDAFGDWPFFYLKAFQNLLFDFFLMLNTFLDN